MLLSKKKGKSKGLCVPRVHVPKCRCWAVLTRLQNCCGCTVSLPCLIATGMTPPAEIVETCGHQYPAALSS